MYEQNEKNNNFEFNNESGEQATSSAEQENNNMATSAEATKEISAEEKMQQLEREKDELKDKYLRLAAEFENYKRRSSKEKMEIIQTAGKDIILSLLEVLDDCDRAEKQLKTARDIEAIKEGVLLVFNKLRNILQSKGLKAMDSVQTDFDVHKHEAVAELPASTPEQKGKVIDEVQKGYYLNDKLIRVAKVVVGK
jgi:molecular chaperone GrpE